MCVFALKQVVEYYNTWVVQCICVSRAFIKILQHSNAIIEWTAGLSSIHFHKYSPYYTLCTSSKEVQEIFDKYMHDGVARRLKKDDALDMLMHEFGLTHEQAEKMFNMFDQDKNNIMSIWEFQQFYICVGNT